jgi:hypothetical protein
MKVLGLFSSKNRFKEDLIRHGIIISLLFHLALVTGFFFTLRTGKIKSFQ